MTPPPTATHAASTPVSFGSKAAAEPILIRLTAGLLKPRRWVWVRLGVDVTVLYLASLLAIFASPMHQDSRWLAAVFPLIVLCLLYARRGPDERLQASRLETAAHIVGVVSLAAMLTLALDAFAKGGHAVAIAVRLWLFACFYLAAARALLVSVRRQALRTPRFATPTLIVGAGQIGEHLVKRLMGDPGYGLRPVGFLDSDPLRTGGSDTHFVPVLGGTDQLAKAAEETGARHVILAFSNAPDHVLVERVREWKKMGLEVSLVPRMFETLSWTMSEVSRCWRFAPSIPTGGSSQSSTHSIARLPRWR
jgi:FlaA1/EpsC-like NDP-sugar epimerase